jgi:alpha-N-arabinofuranosidase
MYAAHQGGQAVRSVFNAPDIHYDRDAKPASFWALNGSASLRDKNLVVTTVNPSVTDSRETQLVIHDAKIKSATATVLTHSDIHAHNTFDQRSVVTPQTKNIDAPKGSLVYTFPPASVTKLILELA